MPLVLLQNQVGTADARLFIANANVCCYFHESNLLKMAYLDTKVTSITRRMFIYDI